MVEDCLNCNLTQLSEEVLSNITKTSDWVITENFQKLEIKKFTGVLTSIIEDLSSKHFTEFLKEKFNINDIELDKSFDGGGLTFTKKGGFLRYHADFPYSDKVEKYRILNAILYLNYEKIEGGNLHLIDNDTKTVEEMVNPEMGRLVIFPTSKNTPHGVSVIKNGLRISLNAYYYSDEPLDDRFSPSRTMWL